MSSDGTNPLIKKGLYRCDGCGLHFVTPAAIGGHRGTCDATAEATESAPGTLILVDHGSRTTWHHSVVFNGYEHETACGRAVGCGATDEVRLEIADWHDLDRKSCCDECAGSVRSLSPDAEYLDGGDP